MALCRHKTLGGLEDLCAPIKELVSLSLVECIDHEALPERLKLRSLQYLRAGTDKELHKVETEMKFFIVGVLIDFVGHKSIEEVSIHIRLLVIVLLRWSSNTLAGLGLAGLVHPELCGG